MCASWSDPERSSLEAIERHHRQGEQGPDIGDDEAPPSAEPCRAFDLAYIDFARTRICCCGFSEQQHEREEQK